MILRVKPIEINTTNMTPFEESGYGFFCDIEKEFCIYPRQTIRTPDLYTINEETIETKPYNKLYWNNFKQNIYSLNIKSIFAYIFVSLTSIYITTKLFYKYN